jgi:hypothetical protein
MKTPLRYQITEFDCGSISLLNCITYLFKREEIPAELVKAISTYTLDCYDEYGNLGQKGTSREAVQYLSRWITNFSESKDFGVKCKYLAGNDVTLEKIKDCINNKGCVNLRTYQGCEHYVTITNIDNNFVYIFDPYYYPESHYKNNKNISCITNEPFSYNRKVSIKRFQSNHEHECALGPIPKRECVLFNRK